jgi:predicted phosphodiesterase
MKIGIFQDIHANLPAFQKAIEVFREHHCSQIYHVGDLIGIGPYPSEVMELACSIPDMKFIMGNHDHWFAYGLPHPIPAYMNEEEVAHHRWTHQQIGVDYKPIVQKWPFVQKLQLSNGRNLIFQHYGLDETAKWFKSFIKNPAAADLDQLFDGQKADFIFYGHDHKSIDLSGISRYVNLGSAGCFDKPEVRLGILEIAEEKLVLKKYSIPYNEDGFMEAFEEREVPASAFIKSAFITWEGGF